MLVPLRGRVIGGTKRWGKTARLPATKPTSEFYLAHRWTFELSMLRDDLKSKTESDYMHRFPFFVSLHFLVISVMKLKLMLHISDSTHKNTRTTNTDVI